MLHLTCTRKGPVEASETWPQDQLRGEGDNGFVRARCTIVHHQSLGRGRLRNRWSWCLARPHHPCAERESTLHEKPGRDRGLHRTSPGRNGCKTWSTLADKTLAEALDGAQLST